MKTEHLFQHEAMKTTFSLRLLESNAQLVRDAALAAIAQIDAIENSLSRYIEGSDVSQINHMKTGESLFISETCYECLLLSLEASEQTGGLFDITIGKRIEHQKNNQAGSNPTLEGKLQIDPDRPAIHCIQAGREIDLGGIGKGFALDQIQTLLKDWNIPSALLSAGASTQLAYGENVWPITLEHAGKRSHIELQNTALSASGTEIQGSHIMSPRDESATYTYPRIWALNKSAAFADAYSTAALLMDADELRSLRRHTQIITPDDLQPSARPPNSEHSA